MEIEGKIQEMVDKYLPLKDCRPSTCSTDKMQLIRRREKLKEEILFLLNKTKNDGTGKA